MIARLLALLIVLAAPAAQGQVVGAEGSSAPILHVLRDADGDRVPDAVDQRVTVRGVLSTEVDAFGSIGPTFYLQDVSGGLAVSLRAPSETALRAGDRVQVTGTLSFGSGMAVLRDARVDEHAPGAEPPEPVAYDAANPERVEGRLVEVEGILVGESEVEAGTALSVTLDDRSLLVAFLYAEARETIDTRPFRPGDRIRVTGIAGQYDRAAPYDDSYQIYPHRADGIEHAGIPADVYRQGALAILGLLVVVGGWAAILRRQVRRRVDQLQLSEDRYRKVVDLASDAIVIHDLDGGNTELNRAAREAIGIGPDAPAPAILDMIWPEDAPLMAPHVACLQQSGRSRVEIRIAGPEGSRLFEVESQLVELDGGVRVLSLARDISAQHVYEQGLIEAREQAEETARVKSAFLASMSHEIRTPLTAVIGFAELLRYEVADDQIDLVLAIEAGGTRLLNTLNSVLDLAQMDAGGQTLRPQPVDLVEHVQRSLDVLRPLAEGRGLELAFGTALGSLPASVDPGAFDRVLTNLVGNAVKFTDEGHITIDLATQGENVVVTVSDTGIGIEKEFLPDLFSEFRQESEGHTRSHEGSGLGLAITHRLVELMGGAIAVASEKGVGTTFTVTVPRVQDTAPTEAMLVTAREAPRNTEESPVGLAELLG